MAALEDRAVVPEDGTCLTVLECGDGGGPLRAWKEQRQLAERLAGAEYLEEDAVALWRRDPRCEPATRDEVQRIRRIVPVKPGIAAVLAVPATASAATSLQVTPQLKPELKAQVVTSQISTVQVAADSGRAKVP